MKILVISQRWYPDTFGGSEQVASEQARRLAARGHAVTVLTQRVRDILPPFAQEGKLALYRYGSESSRARFGGLSRTDLQEVPKLLNVILNEAKRSEGSRDARGGRDASPPKADQHDGKVWDVAILHHPFSAYAFLRMKMNIPALYIFHTSTAREAEVDGLSRQLPGYLNFLQPWLLSSFIAKAAAVEAEVVLRVEQIAVLSDFSWLLLKGAYSGLDKKIIKLPVGVDLEKYIPTEDRAQARGRLGLRVDQQLVLTVRRFTPRMGLTALIDAMAHLAVKLPQLHLLIIGEGPMKAEIIARIRDKDLQSRITVVGAVPADDLPLYYQAADLFVLPTAAFEGLGMATLEALSAGLPVVGTPAGATMEVLGVLDPTLVTRGISAVDLADGVADFFARSESARQLLGAKARQVAEQYYNWEPAIDELEEWLEKLKIKYQK